MPRAAAFFDVDQTVIRGNSASLYARYLRRHAGARLRDLLLTAYYYGLYKVNRLDLEVVMARSVRSLEGRAEAEYRAFCERFVAEAVVPLVYPEVAPLVARHRAAGHVVALISASINFVVDPLARHLGIEHACSTEIETVAGRLTGTYRRPACFAAGKVHYAEAFCAARGLDLGESVFYTDSATDLPLLERVGHPRPVNPDFLLRREAARRGWPQARFGLAGAPALAAFTVIP
jgi:putative phosphoserine phosphatase/1-acylglycerol-3-phosphate O-acyltransferase